jgi:hypothetical protein
MWKRVCLHDTKILVAASSALVVISRLGLGEWCCEIKWKGERPQIVNKGGAEKKAALRQLFYKGTERTIITGVVVDPRRDVAPRSSA